MVEGVVNITPLPHSSRERTPVHVLVEAERALMLRGPYGSGDPTAERALWLRGPYGWGDPTAETALLLRGPYGWGDPTADRALLLRGPYGWEGPTAERPYGWEGPMTERALLLVPTGMENRKSYSPRGFRASNRPACRESLYRLQIYIYNCTV